MMLNLGCGWMAVDGLVFLIGLGCLLSIVVLLCCFGVWVCLLLKDFVVGLLVGFRIAACFAVLGCCCFLDAV